MEIQGVLTKSKWAVDEVNTEIEFKAKNPMAPNIKGFFKEFSADIYTADEDFTTSEIDFWINPSSICTGDSKRDQHLKGPEFFDVAKHKKILFVGESFEKTDKAEHYELYGELTIKGITKKIKLSVVFGGIGKGTSGDTTARFSITGLINLSDWLLHSNAPDSGRLPVSDWINIHCDLELTKENE